MNRDELEAAVRYRILAGILPKQQCRMAWYGPGRGVACVACDRRVTTEEVEVECDLHGGGTLCFHLGCYDAWSSTTLGDLGR